MFKYEMHLHSSLTSLCGASESTEYIKTAVEKGFSGMVFTNHFYRGNTAISRKLPWQEFVGMYRKDWELALSEGEKEDIDVIFGIEEGYGEGKECLIYGPTPDDYAECPDFPKMPIAEISAFVHEKNGFIACAHPFRVRDYIKNPDKEPDASLFDGVEVYNRGNCFEENLKALEFARKNNLVEISGGDVHRTADFGGSGIIFPKRVKNEKELAAALKSRNFEPFDNGSFFSKL